MEHVQANTRAERIIRAIGSAETVAIVRLGSNGDVIATLPFAWFLRNILRPGTRIVWIAHPGPGDLIRGVKAVDQIVTLPRGPILGTIPVWRRILRKIQADAVFDLHGNSKSGLVTRLTGARIRIGFDRKDCREILNCLATNWKLPPLSTGNKTRRAVEVARLLGHSNPVVRFDLEFTPDEMQRARSVIESWAADGSAVILVQLGRLEDVRSWPPRNFVELTAALSGRGCRVVVLGGPDELATGRVFRDLLGPPDPRVRLEIGTLSLREVGALCHLLAQQRSGAHAFIGSDSGCLHLAAACGLRTLGLFGPQDPARTAPVAPAIQTLSHPEAADCIPCSRRECNHEVSCACMQSITTDEVLTKLLRIEATAIRPRRVESATDSLGDIGPGCAHVSTEIDLKLEPGQAQVSERSGTGLSAFDRKKSLTVAGILLLFLTVFLIAVLRGEPLSNAESDVVTVVAQIWQQDQLPVSRRNSAASPCCPGAGHAIIAGFLRIFGVSASAARLPSVIAAFGLVGITYLLARRLSDHVTGLIAALALLCTYGILTGACTVNIYLPAAFCIGGGALLYLEAGRGTTTVSQAAVPLAVLAAVLAALIQGPSGLLIPTLALVAFHAAERNLKRLLRPVLLISALGALAVLGAWISVLGISQGQSPSDGISLFLHGYAPKTAQGTGATVLAPIRWVFVSALPISLVAPFALFAHLKIRRYREDLGFGDRRWRLPKAALVAGMVALALTPTAAEGAVVSLLPFLAVLVASWVVFTIRSWRGRSAAAA